MKLFSQDQLEAIAGALGDTDHGLQNSEIGFLLQSAKMVDPGMAALSAGRVLKSNEDRACPISGKLPKNVVSLKR